MFPFMGGLNGDDFGPACCGDIYDDAPYSDRGPLTCKYCGRSGGRYGFVWKKTKNGRWWLWHLGNQAWHKCK